MKCHRIRLLLDDYINNNLSVENRVLVEHHIESCKNCSEEIEFLKKYLFNMKKIQKEEAPEDLLENIKARLEREGFIDKIKNVLFFPVKIKIPLEIFGVVVTAILIFLILNPFNIILPGFKEKKMFAEKPISEESLVKTDGEVNENKESFEKEFKDKKINLAEKKDEVKKPMITDDMKSGDIEMNKAEQILDSKKTASLKLYNIALNVIPRESITEFSSIKKEEAENYKSRSIEPEIMMKKEALSEKKSEIPYEDETASKEREKEGYIHSDYKSKDAHYEIEKIINDLGGRIISDKVFSQKDLKNIIMLEISEEKYGELINKLNQIGKTETLENPKEDNKKMFLELNLLLER